MATQKSNGKIVKFAISAEKNHSLIISISLKMCFLQAVTMDVTVSMPACLSVCLSVCLV